MSKLVALKRAVMAQLAALPEVAEALPFGKLFEADDVSQVSFRSPAVFVAVLASPDSEAQASGDSRTRVECVAAIAATGRLGVPQDEQALAVAEAVFKAARWARWGVDQVWPSQRRRMEFLPAPGKKGVALLAVRWEHFVVIDDADADPDAGMGDWPTDPAVSVRGLGDA